MPTAEEMVKKMSIGERRAILVAEGARTPLRTIPQTRAHRCANCLCLGLAGMWTQPPVVEGQPYPTTIFSLDHKEVTQLAIAAAEKRLARSEEVNLVAIAKPGPYDKPWS
eukprot:4858837-Prymnesium_polylepis.2